MKDIFKTHTILFLLIPMLLSIIGVIFIMSTGQSDNGFSSLYLRQIAWIIIGIGICFVILSVDYYYIVEVSVIPYTIGLLLLVLTFFIGKEVKGAQSWLGIGGFGIQGSEIMKICYIIFYARFLRNVPKDEKEIKTFCKSLVLLIPPLVLILLQPDMGTAIIFCSIYVAMTFIGFQKISILLSLIAVGIITAILIMIYTYYQLYYININENIPFLDTLLSQGTFIAISVILLIYAVIAFIIELIQPIPWLGRFTRISIIMGLAFLTMGIATTILKPYQWNRLLVFINPEFDRLGSGYNVIQSQIAIGSGGLTGQGLFQGSQNLRGFLPEKHTDFIFAIISEEWGFVGSFIVIVLYGIYSILIVRTILASKDPEGAYISTGILAMFITHIAINIGMNLGIAPVTGLPLPFISYGGSFYIVCITSSALLLNIYSRRFVH